MIFSEMMNQSASVYGLELNEAQLKAFSVYNDMLLDWNQKINLTAITDPQEVATKHMVDSLSCLDSEVFTAGCTVVDVGTGAGFPGIPLKIYRPDLKLSLVDSLNKRLMFLKEVVEQLGLAGVGIFHARAEEAGRQKQHREQYQVAVSRAVAKLSVLAELCLPFVAPGGFFVALKGAQYEEELEEGTRAINVLGGKVVKVKPVKLPGLEDKRAVIYIKKAANTPAVYPRRPGTPEKKPL